MAHNSGGGNIADEIDLTAWRYMAALDDGEVIAEQ